VSIVIAIPGSIVSPSIPVRHFRPYFFSLAFSGHAFSAPRVNNFGASPQFAGALIWAISDNFDRKFLWNRLRYRKAEKGVIIWQAVLV